MDKSASIYQLHWIGRFGNRIFQYAFVNEWARVNEGIAYIPSQWEGDVLFKPSLFCKVIDDNTLRLKINQTDQELDTLKYRRQALDEYNKQNNKNIIFLDTRYINDNKHIAFDDLNCMYFRYMHKKMNPENVQQLFQFNDTITSLEIYKELYKQRGTYTVAHLRRGDIANKNYQGAHSMITKASYLKAFAKFGDSEKNIIWLSDDINERTQRPSVLSKNYYNMSSGHRWQYPSGELKQENSEIVFDFLIELLLLKFAGKIYRANSSFSWFGAFISDAIVYSPIIKPKPFELKNKHCISDCEFVLGNKEPFMGAREEGFEEVYFGKTI